MTRNKMRRRFHAALSDYYAALLAVEDENGRPYSAVTRDYAEVLSEIIQEAIGNDLSRGRVRTQTTTSGSDAGKGYQWAGGKWI